MSAVGQADDVGLLATSLEGPLALDQDLLQ